MLELTQDNVLDYLKGAGKLAAGEQPVLVQSLSGGVAGTVLKIFDSNAGPKMGSDVRSEAQKKRNAPDLRMSQGIAFVLKQPLHKFKTQEQWLVDLDRVVVERDCMALLADLLPKNSVPEVLWFDEANSILAMAAAPTDSILWKKQLLSGRISSEAALHAGMLLAIMHSSTMNDPPIKKRFGNPRLFIQQRTDPYLAFLTGKHPDLKERLEEVIALLVHEQACLIHGDFSPKNIFLVPAADAIIPLPAPGPRKGPAPPTLAHLILLDFEVAFFGNPAFDVATLINHLLLKAFYLGKPWRAAMIAIDAFWQTYVHTADQRLVAMSQRSAGRVLSGLLLARVDGKSPAEYLSDKTEIQNAIRACARKILIESDGTLDAALDLAADALAELAP
jgi:hypothetical protein